jgi:hypothetical protein
VVNRRLAACCCALLLLLGNTAVVQVVAWSAMIAQRSLSQGVSDAVASTLSGERPCLMCRTASELDRRADPALPSGVSKQLKKAEAPLLPALPVMPVVATNEASLVGWPAVAALHGVSPAPELPPPRC